MKKQTSSSIMVLGSLLGATLAVSTTLGACDDGSDLVTPPPTGVGGGGGAGGAGNMGGMGGDGLGFTVGNGGNAQGGSENCGESTVEATLTPANILFVIDRSGSMNCNPPPLQTSTACELNPTPVDPMQPSKWDIVVTALQQAIAAMPTSANVGLALFNNDDDCGVAQAPVVPLAPVDATQLGLIQSSIDAVTPLGSTPIVGGVTLGYAHMYYDVPLPGNDFVVLLTDGAETCAENLQDHLVNETVPQALDVNIATFVIGAPGSEPARSLLSRIAYAGGTPRDPQCNHDAAPADAGNCHFDMTDPSIDFATELAAALEEISGQALACEFDVPEEVGGDVDYDKVNVTFSPGTGPDEDLAQDNDLCSEANGWQYNADKTKIVLCGPACEMVQSDPDGKITITLGCETVVK
jgi:hypothetical protein